MERRNRSNKDKKKTTTTTASSSISGSVRSKSRDRGLADLRTGGRRTVKHLVNTLLGKDHKNHIFGAKDHKGNDYHPERRTMTIERLRERRLSAPGLSNAAPPAKENGELSMLASETRSLMLRDGGDALLIANKLEESQRRRLASNGVAARRMIGHPSTAAMSEAGFPLASRPHMKGGTVGAGQGAMYRRFQDSSFSSFRHTATFLVFSPYFKTKSRTFFVNRRKYHLVYPVSVDFVLKYFSSH